jgi:hypothetical protein
MPIDAYSLCPGGTGKKIKFCCADFVSELSKIDRLLDGQQPTACLQYVEQLLEGGRPRACLLAIKGMLLRASGQLEAAAANSDAFLQQFPDNPVALAESAILATLDAQPEAAIQRLQQAMATASETVEHRVYEAMGIVAQCMLESGHWPSARALWHAQMLLDPDDPAPSGNLLGLNRDRQLPLILKDDPPLRPAPEGAPWANRLEAAMQPLREMRWLEAARALTALAEELPVAPVVWRNLAIVRSWLADRPGTIEALKKFAALAAPEGPLDDAVEAEALAMLLSADPLGDLADLLKLTWTVRDAPRLQEALLGEPRAVQIPFDPAAMAGDETPPPRLICLLLDRRPLDDADTLSLETMPQVLGEALLFGRQTDREARLEVLSVSADQVEALSAWLTGLAGDAIRPPPQQESVAKTSASRDLLRTNWQPPRNAPQPRLLELVNQHVRRALLEQWPARPLGILGGKSPAEAAAEAAEKVKLLAAILVLETWENDPAVKFDFNDLRRRLGLPPLEPLDLAETAPTALPLVRLGRVAVRGLSDEGLLLLFRRARLYGARDALRNSAQEIIQRSSLAGQPECLRAYSALAQTAEDFPQALTYVDQGRQAAGATGQSCASWDLLELSFRFGHGDGPGAARLIQHVQQRHMAEPGVAEALTHMLIEVGALRPDGSPAQAPPSEEALLAGEGPGAAEPGKLWTPDSPQSGGGGKIWTPG